MCSAKEEPEDGVAATPDDETPAIAEIKDVKRYDEIFRPHKELREFDCRLCVLFFVVAHASTSIMMSTTLPQMKTNRLLCGLLLKITNRYV